MIPDAATQMPHIVGTGVRARKAIVVPQAHWRGVA